MSKDADSLQLSRVISSWSKCPYGVRLPEDPGALFATILEQEAYGIGADTVPAEQKQYLQGWFAALATKPSETDLKTTADNKHEDSPVLDDFQLYNMPNYTDTRVGGNDAINPYWQFNRDDDIVPNMLEIPGVPGTSEEYGMGRVYSERYDSNQQILWLSMGVAEYTDLISFYMDSGDASAATTMLNGTVLGLPGKILRLAIDGTIWAFTFPIQTGMWFFKWISRSDMSRVTKYYWFNPSMTLYYEMVNSMLSYLAVGMGLYPSILRRRMDSTKMLTEDTAVAASSEYSTMVDAWGAATNNVKFDPKESGIPEILKDGPDIFVIINRRAKLFAANRTNITTRQMLEASANVEKIKDRFTGEHGRYKMEEKKSIDGSPAKWIWNKISTTTNNAMSALDRPIKNAYSSMKETMFGAGDFVGFKIERSSNASESVSNDTGPSAIAQTLNNISETAKEDYENSLGGNNLLKMANALTKGGKEGFTGYLKQATARMATGAVSAIGFGDIGSIITNGNGFLNIPDVWKNSSFSKSYSFSIELNSRYGDPISIYQSNYIPMTMLLATALPRSVGTSMYTSPFLIKAYCKGQFAIPCGIVSSLDITRGKEEHGWNNTMLPTSISISLSIKDLTPAMFLGMGDIGLFDTFSRNEAMHEYLDTLSALGISERKFLLPQMIRKASAALLVKRNTIFSSTYWGSRMGRTGLARAVAYIAPFGNHDSGDLKYNATTWKM